LEQGTEENIGKWGEGDGDCIQRNVMNSGHRSICDDGLMFDEVSIQHGGAGVIAENYNKSL
jgi:hypothetical protein